MHFSLTETILGCHNATFRVSLLHFLFWLLNVLLQAELRRAQVAAVEMRKDAQIKKAMCERKLKLVLSHDFL